MKVRITDGKLKSITLDPDVRKLVIWDDQLAGFGAVVMRNSIAFVANRRVDGKLARETLGHWSGRGGDLDVAGARRKAMVMLGRMEAKEPTPNRIKRARSQGPTLAEAVELYLDHLTATGSRPSSIATVRREMLDRGGEDRRGAYVRAWLDRPLVSILPKECRAQHEEITRDHGPHVANRVMRQLRAVWNYFAKEVAAGTVEGVPDDYVMPGAPTIAIVWNTEGAAKGQAYVERRREPIPWSKLPAWYAAVQALPDVRRDYNMVVLLTGLRRRDAASIRWEHLNLTDKPRESRVWNAAKLAHESITLAPASLLRPSPKGGAKRAFSIPLSKELVKLLRARHADNTSMGRDDGGWVFPTRALKSDDERGEPCYVCRDLGMPPHAKGAIVHISEPKEESDVLVGPHRLRDSYTTALAEVTPALSPYVIDVLTNHRPPRGSVTAGYVDLSLAHLAECQERVSRYIMTRTRAPEPERKGKAKGKRAPKARHLTLVA